MERKLNYKYYCRTFNIGPGACPPNGIVRIKNFKKRKTMPSGVTVWAEIIYDHELTENDLEAYDFISSESKYYYCISYSVSKDDNSIFDSKIKCRKLSKERPTNQIVADDLYFHYEIWLESREEAESLLRILEVRGVPENIMDDLWENEIY
jgi:hypothetical protein